MHITPCIVCALRCASYTWLFNVWVTRWMHGIAPPTRPSHVAAHDWTEPAKAVTKRGGLHKNVARDIDEKFWDGTFDLEAFADYCKDLEYDTPVNHSRNQFAKSFAALEDSDEKEAALFSYRGFLYCVWNRKVTSVQELRERKFEELFGKEREHDAAVAATAEEEDSELE